jgi:hypothetical protein
MVNSPSLSHLYMAKLYLNGLEATMRQHILHVGDVRSKPRFNAHTTAIESDRLIDIINTMENDNGTS